MQVTIKSDFHSEPTEKETPVVVVTVCFFLLHIKSNKRSDPQLCVCDKDELPREGIRVRAQLFA